MNATLKAIQQLIHHQDVNLQLAAIRILSAINSREPAIHKTLGDLLVETTDPNVFQAALEAVEASPHEQILRHLVRILDKNDEYLNRILDAIAKIGPKAVQPLKQQFEKMPPDIQRRMIRVFPRIRSHHAHTFLVDCLAHPDPQLVREAVHSIREEIKSYSSQEKSDLFGQLSNALKDKRFKQNESSLAAVVIALGIIADLRAKQKLLPFINPNYSVSVRRYTLMSLACLPFPDEPQAELANLLYPLLDDPDYEGLVRHAVAVLSRLKTTKEEQDRLRALLRNRHPGVRIMAIEKLSHLDSAANAQLIMEFVAVGDQDIKDAAVAALSRMPSSVSIILKAIDDNVGQIRSHDLQRILTGHPARLSPDRVRSRVKRMLEMQAAGDRRYELQWEALKSLRPDVLQSEILKLADEAFAAGNYELVKGRLNLLDRGGLLTPEMRYRLMLAVLKTSDKSRSRSSRSSDPSLEHAALLLVADPREFKRHLLAEKILNDEDFLYLGYHFSERLNEERRFGADLLRHVTSKWPRRQSAKIAKQKLQVEGH